MNAGAMRHQIELQSFTSTPDGMGGTVDVFSTVDTVWAAIWPTSASEHKKAASPTMVASHQVRIRYYAGLSAAWRLKLGSRYFSIVSIIDKEERHVQMDLLCNEVLP